MLPIFHDQNRNLMQMQTRWATLIDPVISIPMNNGVLLPKVLLAVGSNVINHKLQRKLQGWFIVRQRAAAEIYDTQDLNQMQDLTLTLNSSAIVSVDIWVF